MSKQTYLRRITASCMQTN